MIASEVLESHRQTTKEGLARESLLSKKGAWGRWGRRWEGCGGFCSGASCISMGRKMRGGGGGGEEG